MHKIRAILFLLIPLALFAETTTTAREIALTFDDAPTGNGAFFSGAERSQRLLEALVDVYVDGTLFFVATANIQRSGTEGIQRLQNYAKAGHFLASHSHQHLSLNTTPPSVYLADLDESLAALESFDSVLPFFRFPFLHEGRTLEYRDPVREGLDKRGLKNGYVTIDNYDWYMDNLTKEAARAGHAIDMDVLRSVYIDVLIQAIEFYDAVAQNYLKRSPRHILLLHENDLAALFIDDLVIELRQRGWVTISAPEAYTDPIASHQPKTFFLNQGRVAAIANERGAPAKELIHPAEDEEYLRRLFLERGLLPVSHKP